ncbi:hypothetical protein DFQ27_006594, partial [Actinomortierella ambigua]
MLSSPYRTRAQHKRTFNSTRDPSPDNPLLKGTQLTTTVDTLLLPGVIGTTVEGPKTPLRSSRGEPGSTGATPHHANNHWNHSRMTPPLGYNDDRYDSDDQLLTPASGRGLGRSQSETPKKDRIQHSVQGFRTPQPHRVLGAAEWRKKYRPRDTPNARAVSTSTGLDNAARSPSWRTRQRSTAALYDNFTPLQEVEDGEEEQEECEGEEFQDQHYQGLILDGHDSKGTRSRRGHMRTADATDDENDDNGMHMADDSGLDVESDREGQHQSYDSLAYRDLSDAHAYSDEEILTRRIKREEQKEAKRRRRQERLRLRLAREEDREKNQLGFLRRLVNMFSPDDYINDSASSTGDDDDLSSLPESEDINNPPSYHKTSTTAIRRTPSAFRKRVSAGISTSPSGSPQQSHFPAALWQLSGRSASRSLDTYPLLADEVAKSDYHDTPTSDDDDLLGDISPHQIDYETQYRTEEDHTQEAVAAATVATAAAAAAVAAQSDQSFSRQRQRRHQYPLRDSQRAAPRVYPWHVIARMSRQQYQHVCAALSTLSVTMLDTALALRDGLTALLMALWATILTLCGGLSAWLKEGINSGLFSPRTLTSVGLLMLVIIAFNVLASSGLVERSWASLANTYHNPVAWTDLDISTKMTAAMDRIGNSLFSRNSTPSPSAPWESIDSQPSPTGLSVSDAKFQTQQAKRLEAIEARLLLIQKTLAQLNGADQELEKQLRAQLNDLAGQISAVDSKVEHVIQDVNTLKYRLQSGVWLNQTVMEMIQDELPRYLVISKNQTTGQLIVPAEFWQMAREMLVAVDEMAQVAHDRRNKERQQQDNTLDGESLSEEQVDDRNAGQWSWIPELSKKRQKSRQWANFLKDHEKALTDFVDQRQAVVSRQSFLGLVRTEAASIWRAIEPQVLPWLERRGRLSPHSSPSPSSSSSSSSSWGGSNEAIIGSILTEAEREAMSLLIDEALERYTADAIAKPDYALYSAGGRIIPKLTTRCEDLRFLGHVITLFLRPPSHKPPEYAIRPGTTPGECWALDGDHGQLGIRLARQIIPTEVTIEHADMRVVLDMGSAPKDFELWGITEDAIGRGGSGGGKKTVLAKNSQPPSQDTGSNEPDSTGASDDEKEAAEDPEAPWPGAFLLTRDTYQVNISAASGTPDALSEQDPHVPHPHPRARQTFPIPVSKQKVPVMGVVLKIKSNW